MEPVSLEWGQFYILSMHTDINYILMAVQRSRLLTVLPVVSVPLITVADLLP